MSSQNQMERRLERMETEKNRKVGSVTIEIIERVRKTFEKPGNSRIIMRVIEKLEEKPKIKKIARIIELNELAKCLYINLRIESKKLFLVLQLQNISPMEKIPKQSPSIQVL